MKKRTIVTLLLCMVLGLSLGPAGFPGSAEKAYAATGPFTVSGTKILDGNNNEFVIKGTNINGWNWVWPSDPVPDANTIANVWKFNAVRVNEILNTNDGNPHNTYGYANADAFHDALVNAYTSRGVVVMFALHDLTGGYLTDTTTPTVTQAANYFAGLAQRYKNNPLVWFNTKNEPGSGGSVATQPWREMNKTIIQAIRNTGNTNIVVVDGAAWAQEAGAWGDAYIQEANSAILTYGQELLNWHKSTFNNNGNVVFSIHPYDQWSYGSSQASNDARAQDYITRVQNKGLALIAGEYGAKNTAANQQDSFQYAAQTVFNVFVPRNIGRLVWHYRAGDEFDLTYGTPNGAGFEIDRTDGVKPGNLSWLGERVWNDTHGIASTVKDIPGTIEAERFDASNGMNVHGSNEGPALNNANSGDWTDYKVNVSTAGTYQVEFRVTSGASSGKFELRNSSGTVLSATTVPYTGGWNNYTTLTATVTLPAGQQTLRLQATGDGFNLNWMKFTLQGGGGSPGGTKVTGTAFGTSPAWGGTSNTYDKAFDGSTSTFFDYANADGGYTGIDAGTAKKITKVRFYPRATYAGRMVGGKFQGSNTSSSSGFVDLATISGTPAEAWNELTVTNTNTYRYLRYLSPNGSYGNVAEVEFYTDSSGSGTQLIVNPGFETGSLSPWFGEYAASLAGIESNYPKSGTKDAFLHPTSTQDTGIAQTVTAPATKTYTLTAYCATNISNNVWFGVEVNGAGAGSRMITSGNGYTQYTITFNATAGQTIKVWYYAGKVNGWATIDDVSLS